MSHELVLDLPHRLVLAGARPLAQHAVHLRGRGREGEWVGREEGDGKEHGTGRGREGARKGNEGGSKEEKEERE